MAGKRHLFVVIKPNKPQTLVLKIHMLKSNALKVALEKLPVTPLPETNWSLDWPGLSPQNTLEFNLLEGSELFNMHTLRRGPTGAGILSEEVVVSGPQQVCKIANPLGRVNDSFKEKDEPWIVLKDERGQLLGLPMSRFVLCVEVEMEDQLQHAGANPKNIIPFASP